MDCGSVGAAADMADAVGDVVASSWPCADTLKADAPPALLAPRPQDYIIPQEDIVKYRETELNLFITSADRDWFRNTTENRYNFTVNFKKV